MHFKLRAAAASLRGRGHAENQDAWCLARGPRVGGVGAVYAVADGVSSVPRGRWAARTACARVQTLVGEGRLHALGDLVQLVSEVDWELREHGRGSAACTLSVLWLHADRLTMVHVGDSAVYRVRGGRVQRLSRDMSSGSRLEAWLGMGPAVSDQIQVTEERLRAGDGLLLVTDGVEAVIRHTELAGWWQHTGQNPVRCTRGTIREVARRKGKDDATIIAISVDPPE